MNVTTIGSPAMWVGFIGFVLAMLLLDLGVINRKTHEISIKEAVIWSAVWVTLATLFGAGIYYFFGAHRAMEFATGYLIEKALAVDNIFIFLVIFSYFAVPKKQQHRVLFWGVLGALVMRGALIGAGAALLQRFSWVLYIFGGILLLTSFKLLRERDDAGYEPDKNPAVRLFRKLVPMTDGPREGKFFVVEEGKRLATPLLLTLAVIEVSDVVFAVDSIPAIFSVTRDPFIVFTSNIFAILGLRSMYFLLSGVMEKFHYLKVGLALVLGFIGAKMLLVDLLHIPIALSLGVVVVILAAAIGASMIWPRPLAPAPREG